MTTRYPETALAGHVHRFPCFLFDWFSLPIEFPPVKQWVQKNMLLFGCFCWGYEEHIGSSHDFLKTLFPFFGKKSHSAWCFFWLRLGMWSESLLRCQSTHSSLLPPVVFFFSQSIGWTTQSRFLSTIGFLPPKRCRVVEPVKLMSDTSFHTLSR